MTFPDAMRQLKYWRCNPPVHELLAVLASVFTTWKPQRDRGAQTPDIDGPLPESTLPEFEP